MKPTEVLLSRLAAEQLTNLSPPAGRAMIQAFTRLIIFPESAPIISLAGYESYRQLIVREYRAIYRYFPEDDTVRIYCILHLRRQLPGVEFLTYQVF